MVSYLLFDLDNTLYPSSSGISPLVDDRMIRYVSAYLGIDYDQALALRETKLKQYDHTLTWLMEEYRFSAIEAFMTNIHDLDLQTLIPKNGQLKSLLDSIPLSKSILTNAPVEHALRVMDHLDVRAQFERIFDTRFHRFNVKPNPAVYQDTVKALNLDFKEVMLIDDIPDQLFPFQQMGGAVLLVDETGSWQKTGLPSVTGMLDLPGALAKK